MNESRTFMYLRLMKMLSKLYGLDVIDKNLNKILTYSFFEKGKQNYDIFSKILKMTISVDMQS